MMSNAIGSEQLVFLGCLVQAPFQGARHIGKLWYVYCHSLEPR